MKLVMVVVAAMLLRRGGGLKGASPQKSASEGAEAPAKADACVAVTVATVDTGVPHPAKCAQGLGRHLWGGSSPFPAVCLQAKCLSLEYICNGPVFPLCFCIFKIAFTHLFLKSCHISSSYQALINVVC